MDKSQAERVKAARARLAKKFKGVNTRIGGKGTQKRKLKKKEKGNMSASKKLKNVEKRLGAQPLPDIHEVNLFHNSGDVWHFNNPRITGSIQNQALIVSGEPEMKNLAVNFAEFISQLGPREMGQMKNLLEKQHKEEAAKKEAAAAEGKGEEEEEEKAGEAEKKEEEEEDEDEAPELVDFDEVAQEN